MKTRPIKKEFDLKKFTKEVIGYPDRDKYIAEVDALQDAPPVLVEIPPVAVLAILCLLQVSIQQPGVADDPVAKIGIAAGRKLQEVFSPDSEIYKAIGFGWNPESQIFSSVASYFQKMENQNPEVLDM